MGEDENTVSSFEYRLQEFKHGSDFGLAAGSEAQSCYLCQSVNINIQVSIKHSLCSLSEGFVGELLFFAHCDMLVDFLFIWEFAGHLILGATEHEGFDKSVQQLLDFLVFVLLYGYDEATVKFLEGTEQAGIDKLEEVPEFTEVVLHGSTSEHNAVA